MITQKAISAKKKIKCHTLRKTVGQNPAKIKKKKKKGRPQKKALNINQKYHKHVHTYTQTDRKSTENDNIQKTKINKIKRKWFAKHNMQQPDQSKK